MTQITQGKKATGTQLLEQILEQIALQTDVLSQVCTRLGSLIEMLGVDHGMPCENSSIGNGHAERHQEDRKPQGKADPTGQAGQVVEFDATEIVTTLDDSGARKMFRIKGGQFSMYGLRVWPEVLVDLGLDPDGLKLGSTPFTGRVLARIGVQGKQKVIGLAEDNP